MIAFFVIRKSLFYAFALLSLASCSTTDKQLMYVVLEDAPVFLKPNKQYLHADQLQPIEKIKKIGNIIFYDDKNEYDYVRFIFWDGSRKTSGTTMLYIPFQYVTHASIYTPVDLEYSRG